MNTSGLVKIYVNNHELIVPENFTVEKLLDKIGVTSRAAVWINGKQILLKNYASEKIMDKDRIKVIRVIGGG